MRFKKIDKVTIHNLMVVDFQSECEVPAHKDWKNRKLNSTVPAAEKCGRNIWYSSREDFDDFPEPLPHERNRVLYGPEAYAHLLYFMMGFQSPNGYDRPALERFYTNWSKINNRNPAAAARYEGLIAQLGHDYDLLTETVCKAPRADREWLIARDLTGQKKGSDILIVGDVGEDGNKASSLTERVALTVYAEKACKAKSIDITHPDDKDCEKILRSLRKSFGKKHLRPNLDVCDFHEYLPLAFEMADHVYITLEMGKNPDADQFMIDCWKGRKRGDNFLSHIKASVANRGMSTDLWREAALDNYVSPEDLRNEVVVRKNEYDHIKTVAQSAALFIAEIQAAKGHPKKSAFSEDFMKHELS